MQRKSSQSHSGAVPVSRRVQTVLFTLVAMLALSNVVDARAQGVNGSGPPSSGGGTPGSGSVGQASGSGATLGWAGSCGAGSTMVAWSTTQYPSGTTDGSVFKGNIYDAVGNPKGTVYVAPNTPFPGGKIPGAWNNYKDQNGASYFPWWMCFPVSGFSASRAPTFPGFNVNATATNKPGVITVLSPVCAPSPTGCKDFVVLDTVTVAANMCTSVPATPLPAVIATAPGGAVTIGGEPGCPQSVVIAGSVGTWIYMYTLQWVSPSNFGSCPTGSGPYKWTWGDGSPDTCAGADPSHAYTHVSAGASISAQRHWTPECTGVSFDAATGSYGDQGLTLGSYPCTGAGLLTQPYPGTPPKPVIQIESVPVG